MIGERILLDSSAWISYFLAENDASRNLIEDGNYLLMTSVLSIFEIKRKMLRMKLKEPKIKEILNFIKTRSLMIDLNEKICDHAVGISMKHKLHNIDSLIYSSVILNNATLISGDNHFQGLDKVMILK